MKNENFNEEDLLKTMLQVAKRSRELTTVEQKIDSKLKKVSDSKTDKIITDCCKEGWILSHTVIPQEPVIRTGSTTRYILPFQSYDGEGLSENGEDKLKDLIEDFKDKQKSKIRKCLCICLKWIGGIISALIIAFLIWRFGWK